MNYWLVKSEPGKYSWQQLLIDKKTVWDGIRNYAARNNLKSMKRSDLLLYYHSNEGLEIVGIAEVIKEFYQDPTTNDPAWVAIDIKPKKTLKKTIPLSQIKKDKNLKDLQLVKLGRLSVSVVKEEEFEYLLALAETTI